MTTRRQEPLPFFPWRNTKKIRQARKALETVRRIRGLATCSAKIPAAQAWRFRCPHHLCRGFVLRKATNFGIGTLVRNNQQREGQIPDIMASCGDTDVPFSAASSPSKETSESKPHWNHGFAGVPLVLTFVKLPAAIGYECQNRDTGMATLTFLSVRPRVLQRNVRVQATLESWSCWCPFWF
jgi:hypothetical protein